MKVSNSNLHKIKQKSLKESRAKLKTASAELPVIIRPLGGRTTSSSLPRNITRQ